MKVDCPSCQATIAAEDVHLDTGWAKCVFCDEVFPLADLLPGFPTSSDQEPAPPERPFDARAMLRREPRMLTVHLPAHGLRGPAWFLLGFAVLWLGFVAFWTAAAFGLLFANGGVRAEDGFFAAFSTPFWIAGFVVLGAVLWIARGTRSVMIDAATLVTELRCLVWRRMRTIERDQVQCAQAGKQRFKQKGMPAEPAVDIIFASGTFQIPCTSKAEQAWLVHEINDFLQAVPYDPSMRDWMSDPPREFAG